MKKLLTVLLVLFTMSMFAQTYPIDKVKIGTADATMAKLYSFVKFYKDGVKVITPTEVMVFEYVSSKQSITIGKDYKPSTLYRALTNDMIVNILVSYPIYPEKQYGVAIVDYDPDSESKDTMVTFYFDVEPTSQDVNVY